MYAKQGKTFNSNEEAIKNPEVINIIKEGIDKVNKTLAQYESLKKFELLPREWTVDKGEMTPKLSLKRKVILEANKNLVEKIYKDTL
jgi:long-chain acyl-CoA synthetase